jgi:hypothetical protein
VRRSLIACLVLAAGACRPAPVAPKSYLYVWAGDSAATASDFLAVVDADPASPRYGTIVTSLAVGDTGSHPHHTEAEMPASGHLLANGFHAGKSWLFDLTTPTAPKVLTSFGALAGFDHPHTYTRLANGNLLTTFQYADGPTKATPHEGMGGMSGMSMGGVHATGGLVEMDERGTVIRSASAADPAIADKRIFPYSAIPVPSLDLIASTTTDMDQADTVATSHWIQFWSLSSFKLLRTIPLPAGPRGNEQEWTGEPHLLADGKSLYIHTFGCGLYLLKGIETPTPSATLVKSFAGEGCGVPILTGKWWLQPVPESHALIALDISDPAHPREVSSVDFGKDEHPHWIALDPTGRRVVLNSGGGGQRLFVVDFDPATGTLAIDQKFKDAGSTVPGVSLSKRSFPHGWTGSASPHGTVFSR